MLTAEDYKALAEEFDNRYVRKDDCNTRHENLNGSLADMSVTMTKMSTQLSGISKMGAITLGAIIPALIGALMNILLK